MIVCVIDCHRNVYRYSVKKMGELRIGTCSWKYGSWQGLVYSASRGINFLEEYATKYSTVEIDQWFWSLFGEEKVSLPDPASVRDYRDSVPDGFIFTVKVPNSITLTHFYKIKKSDPLRPNPYFLSERLFSDFINRLEPLRSMLGPLMFQFEYLNKQKMESQILFQTLVHDFLGRVPEDLPYAIEIRNPNYINRSFFEFIKQNRLSPVFLQGYYMPSILQIYERWRSYILEFKTVVIRLHGPNRQKIEKETSGNWSRIIEPKDKELEDVAHMVKEIQSKGINVYLNVNNHYEGSAPLTISRIQNLLAL
jgi:uncharacterized protein YecE (DUF72 family)